MQKAELGHIAVVTQRCCFRLLLLFCRLIRSDSFMTLWTVAHQAPLSMGFPMAHLWEGRQRRWTDRERETVPAEIHPWDRGSSAPSSTKAPGGDLKGPRAEAGQDRKCRVSESGAPGKAA